MLREKGVTHLVRVCAEGNTECPGETEVWVSATPNSESTCRLTGDLEVALLVDEQVLGLQVPVQHPVRVAEVQAFDELVGEFLPSARVV
jgi:hypothetical protein